MDETSLSLLDRARQVSDSESWNHLVELYAPLLRNWLRRYQVQDSDAEDIVQEVLAVVARELPAFQHSDRAGAPVQQAHPLIPACPWSSKATCVTACWN